MSAPDTAGLNGEALARLRAAPGRLIEARRVPGAVAMVVRRGMVGCFESLGQQVYAAIDD